ncbi:hypothetical protein HQ325_01475 [Rhodococcus sp. BP-349]|uniref:hypothetical protein n=1 Tax=unclassified Rhodococcus (in: high G+C Gram-positive bacteria) TaxID=192944 RepID=UPI001C9B3EFB|nr:MULTISPECIES: hypothetical protein [unclassified Rhodococcus (in: high G+C Gram-positive bacteria)]MBY6537331.1 hypothetical protein [Rhodococcus sp. BP-363]MBY6541668.1 hypothetical protein [Rhodococcus sp. BP-369]MBY6560898.1 hypothetical protein [Rhodococcus sp. BP-370]MBY6575190.1 hypothetical protein [Rhodococcus sp. BP-364]MBY6584491.1 hypothetical protein [Rhodococcus sp. BP-358]
MAPRNPHAIADGMTVRSVTRPDRVFRVSGDPGGDRVNFVALSPSTRTVVNGSPRNYRPETPAEEFERLADAGRDDVIEDVRQTEPADDEPAGVSAVADEPTDDDSVAALCVRMQDAVARVADGECDPDDAAAIVSAAAALNAAVIEEHARRG